MSDRPDDTNIRGDTGPSGFGVMGVRGSPGVFGNRSPLNGDVMVNSRSGAGYTYANGEWRKNDALASLPEKVLGKRGVRYNNQDIGYGDPTCHEGETFISPKDGNVYVAGKMESFMFGLGLWFYDEYKSEMMKKNIKIEKMLENLTKSVEMLELHVKFAPGGSGYHEYKDKFERRIEATKEAEEAKESEEAKEAKKTEKVV